MKLTFHFAILVLSLHGLVVAAAEYDLVDEQTNSKKLEAGNVMCSGYHCHEDASCTSIGPGAFECKCNGNLIGDGITACDGPRGPKDESIMELERSLRKAKKNKNKKKVSGDDDDSE